MAWKDLCARERVYLMAVRGLEGDSKSVLLPGWA